MIGRIKLKLLKWLLNDICKRNDCFECFFCERYLNKPVICKRRDKALIDEAEKVWMK